MSFKNCRGTSDGFALLIAIAVMVALAGELSVGINNSISSPRMSWPELGPDIVLATKQPEAPATAVAPDHFTLKLNGIYNGFVGESWKRENHDDDGIPADGRVLVPGVVPRAYFQFTLPDEPNAIQLSSGTPVVLPIPPNQRGKYGRLAILHGSPQNPVTVSVTLHYDSGEDVADELKVQDWNRMTEAKEVYVHKALKAGRVQLFSQILKLDTTRTLESITLKADGKADIFSVTIIVSSDRPFKGGM